MPVSLNIPIYQFTLYKLHQPFPSSESSESSDHPCKYESSESIAESDSGSDAASTSSVMPLANKYVI